MSNVAVVGAGAWGTALAAHAARLDHRVRMWALEPEVAEEIRRSHRNTAYLPGAELPAGIDASTDLAEALSGAELVILVPPSKFLRAVATEVGPLVPAGATVVCATKGVEEGTLCLVGEVLEQAMPGVGAERRVFLSGPSFAKEVFEGLPTDITAASRHREAARRVQALLHSPMFRVYASADPVGVQVGGSVKNVLAIATGAADGSGFGNNARAALITRGLAEMTRLGVSLGGDPLTFLGMAGVGDLILTCTGDLSRNRTLGKRIAEGVDPAAYVASQKTVAEGYLTAAACWELAQRQGVEMPITEQVFHVLHRGRSFAEAVRLLVTRDYKDELDGIEVSRGEP